jgi:anti-anti-sigma regulatory factor
LRTGQITLRISITENENAVGLTLEGRLAGPYVAELDRAWQEACVILRGRSVKLDLRNVTYSDAGGKRALRQIFKQTQADIVTSSPWSEYLAAEIKGE